MIKKSEEKVQPKGKLYTQSIINMSQTFPCILLSQKWLLFDAKLRASEVLMSSGSWVPAKGQM